VAEDHPLVRQGIVQLINRQADLVCCGEVDTAGGVLAAVIDASPDLVLLDLWLGEAGGLDLIGSLHARFPELRILVFSQSDENLYAERSLRAGARGYIMKERSPEEVLASIRAVLDGELGLSWDLTMRLVGKAIQADQPTHRAVNGTLTERELDVFRLLGQGMGTKVIAERLEVSGKTIEAHRENIKHKLGLPHAAALLQAASVWVNGDSHGTAAATSTAGIAVDTAHPSPESVP
jgi:DNA-binding NarL/FixJ family response regulator